MKREQVVYFIEAKGCDLIKIGIACDVKRRVAMMQIGCPYPLELLTVIRGGIIKEGELHRLFQEFRFRREWFRGVPQIRNFIASQPLSWKELVQPVEEEISMDRLRAAFAKIKFPPPLCVTQ